MTTATSDETTLGRALLGIAQWFLSLIIALVVTFGLAFVCLSIDGFVLAQLSAWFFAPIGLPVMTFAQATGIGVVIAFVKIRTPLKNPKVTFWETLGRMARSELASLGCLGVGYMFHVYFGGAT